MNESAAAAKAAKQRRLAEALRANLRRRKAAGQANDEPALAPSGSEPAETAGSSGSEDEG
ncbi:hypothetical protein [Beijerinckia sp. L45]|uniref:hypothetical protein n=1 Tax=Beijerinckia sp. L45 TaxID=1641855 RepID=UPI00131E942D|nr:hypothetical protein [Beijerinckia sp. L45]